MNICLKSIFVTIFLSCLCSQSSYAKDSIPKIQECNLDDPDFKKEIMDEILKDDEYRKIFTDEKNTNKKAKRRDPEADSVVMSHADYEIKKNFDYTSKSKDIFYYGNSVDMDETTQSISFDSNINSIEHVTACTIYYDPTNNRWRAKTVLVSEPVPDSLSSTNIFSSDKEIKIKFPTESPRFYTVLMYKMTTQQSFIKGYPHGYSRYIKSFISSKTHSYNLQYTITIPADMKHYAELKTKKMIRAFNLVKLTDDKNKIKYILSTDTAPILSESNSSMEDYMLPYFAFSTFDSWETIFKDYSEMIEDKISDGNVIIENELEKIVKYYDKKPTEKLTALEIYYYVSKWYSWENYHNEAGGGLIPHDIKDIVYKHQGDCKDIALVFTSLLRAAGYKAYPVRIRANAEGMMNYDLETPVNVFNHVITGYYEQDGTFKILDASAHNNSFYTGLTDMNSNRNYVTWTYDDKGALSIKKGRTPVLDQSASVQKEYSFDVVKDGTPVACNVKFQSDNCDGWAGDLNRAINSKSNESSKKSAVREHVLSGENVKNFTYDTLERSNDYISVKGQATLGETDSKTTYVPNSDSQEIMIDQRTPSTISIDDATDRYTDYILANRTSYYDATFIYNVPDGYVIKAFPTPMALDYDSDYLSFHVNFKINGNRIEYYYFEWVKKIIIPAQECKEEAEKMKALKDYVSQKIVFKKVSIK